MNFMEPQYQDEENSHVSPLLLALLAMSQQNQQQNQKQIPEDYLQYLLRQEGEEGNEPYTTFGSPEQALTKARRRESNYRFPNSNNDLLNDAKQAIMDAYPDNPVMQKVALTQAILESGLTGKPSKLATVDKNLFGIKASKSAPGTMENVNYNTGEYGKNGRFTENSNFSRNSSYLDSALQHRKLLEKNKRYQEVIGSNNPENAFQSLQRAGYATDPNYARKLENIYQRTVVPMFNT